LGFGLMMLAGALFAVTGTNDNLFTDQSWLYRWQALIGALIGASAAIFAGLLAWRAVQHQINADRERMLADRVETDRLLTDDLIDYAEGMAAAWRASEALGGVPLEQEAECTRRVREAISYMATQLSRRDRLESYRAMAETLGWERRNPFMQLIRRLEEFERFGDFEAQWMDPEAAEDQWDLEAAINLMRWASYDFEWCLPGTSKFFTGLW